jgi:hypothetical protein
MIVQSFMLIDDVRLPDGSQTLSKGTIVYRCIQATYGLVSLDSEITGQRHVAITLDPEGGYPFYTMAARLLEPFSVQ